MAAYDAGAACEDMAYDFTTGSFWAALVESHPDLAEQGRGTVPEPSEDAIMAFQRAQRAALGLDVGADEEEVRKHLMAMTDDEQEAMNVAVLDSYVTLCNGSPSRELLSAVPFRHRRLFYRWLSEEINDPKAAMNGTRPTLVPLRNGG